MENAISVLYDCGFDVEKAIDSLRNCSPNSNQWTKEDRLLFEQGIWYYGKNFHRINQLVRQLDIIIYLFYLKFLNKKVATQNSCQFS